MVLDRALRDGVLVLTMNRPEHRNALNRDLFRELGHAFVGAETDPEVRAIALTGAPMDATRALHYGLVNRVVAASEVLPTAIEIATTIAANAPLAVLLAKEIALDARGLLDPDIAAWRERAAPVFASNDAKEG